MRLMRRDSICVPITLISGNSLRTHINHVLRAYLVKKINAQMHNKCA